MPKPAKAPTVVFVTDRIKDKPSDAALLADADDKFPHGMKDPELFAQPDHCPIQTPAEFAKDFHQSDLWRLGVHEAGHALASLLFVGRVDVLTLTSIDGCEGLGHSYSCGAHGEDGCKVSVGGLAAERLVEGKPFDIGGFSSDMKNARADLRDAGFPEDFIDVKSQDIYRRVQRIFAKDWCPALMAVASALVRCGVISGERFHKIISDAQEGASKVKQAGLFKSLQDVQILTRVGAPHIDRVRFAKDQTAALECMFGELTKAHAWDRAAAEPGIGAFEIIRREVERNHADIRAQEHARGER